MAALPPARTAPTLLDGLISERALAEQLGRSPKTVRRWVRELGLPVAGRRGHLKYFKIEVVRAWLLQERQPDRRRRRASP